MPNRCGVPSGARRLVQKAEGIHATIVNGSVMLENDEHTGNRAGRMLRSTDARA